MKNPLILLAAAAVVLAACNNHPAIRSISAGEHTRVTLDNGVIEGYLDGDIYTFKGIQYAQAERFMPPQDPAPFEGVRMCKLYGPQAPQGETLRWSGDTQRDYSFGNQFELEPMDEENCLVLNVWTPGINDGKKRSVYMWIHGGGYSSGSAHDLPCYEGYAMAQKGDIVVVSINHRLNVLGYGDLSGLGGKYAASVNLGMQDIVKALEWVNRNISRFGGNPDDVTIAGQSGGGGKVSALLAMPSAKGLFHKAIVQSGSSFGFGRPAQTQPQGIAFARELGVEHGPDADFSGFSYDELVAASRRARMGASPVADGTIIAGDLFTPETNVLNQDVPMLIGTNFNEFTFDIGVQADEKQIIEQLGRSHGANAEAFSRQFRETYPDQPAEAALYVDLGFRRGAVNQAAGRARQGAAPAYLYLFTWKPETNVLGASHGMELPFMSNNVSLMREMTGGTARAYRFQETVSDIWLAFIKTGDPNVKGIPSWPAYTEENGATMVLDDKCVLRGHLDDALLGL